MNKTSTNRTSAGASVGTRANKKSPPAFSLVTSIGIILSALVILVAIPWVIFSGILTAVLYDSVEPGWSILGFGMLFFGVVSLLLFTGRLLGFIFLSRMKKSGWIIVMIVEGLSTLLMLFQLASEHAELWLIHFIWSAGIVVYLLFIRHFFFSHSGSIQNSG